MEANMAVDLELEAMAKVGGALTDLDEKAAARVIRWAADKFGVPLIPEHSTDSHMPDKKANGSRVFADIASLFYDAHPATEAERVLVACYWLQSLNGSESVDAQEVNAQLKHLGHGASNITRAFSDLIDRKPHLVMQVFKSGAGKQARKKYKLTTAGVQKVEDMLEHGSSR
jgi:hypothetical protein